MKRIVWLLAAVILLSCVVGCGKAKTEDNTLNTPMESIPLEGEMDHVHGPGDHLYQAETMSEADCVNAGRIVHICVICGEGFEETVEPYGHMFEPATCDQPGCCVNCGAVMEKPTGHTTKNGTCERCGTFVG